jgi:hypothetical protein
MKAVYDVDDKMMDRTRNFLLSRRNGKGGFDQDSKALDSFGRAPRETTESYITYALAATGTKPENIKQELDLLESRAMESDDAYVVALGACALQAAGRLEKADIARDRLKTLRGADGILRGKASITRSGERDLAVETTSFAILAWLSDEKDIGDASDALNQLMNMNQGSGCFGATQATVMALKAISAYVAANPAKELKGELRILVNDEQVTDIELQPGSVRPLYIDDLDQYFRKGENHIQFLADNDLELPFSFSMTYNSKKPANDSSCPLRLSTRIKAKTAQEGDLVPVEIILENVNDEGQPMSMAIIGLPGNVEVSAKTLDDLKKAKSFDFWEIRGNEVVLYWRDMAPGATKSFLLDVIAKIPGTCRGPASRCYLYYSAQSKRWVDPLQIEVVE